MFEKQKMEVKSGEYIGLTLYTKFTSPVIGGAKL